MVIDLVHLADHFCIQPVRTLHQLFPIFLETVQIFFLKIKKKNLILLGLDMVNIIFIFVTIPNARNKNFCWYVTNSWCFQFRYSLLKMSYSKLIWTYFFIITWQAILSYKNCYIQFLLVRSWLHIKAGPCFHHWSKIEKLSTNVLDQFKINPCFYCLPQFSCNNIFDVKKGSCNSIGFDRSLRVLFLILTDLTLLVEDLLSGHLHIDDNPPLYFWHNHLFLPYDWEGFLTQNPISGNQGYQVRLLKEGH